MLGKIWACLNTDGKKPVERWRLKIEASRVIGMDEAPEEAGGQGI